MVRINVFSPGSMARDFGSESLYGTVIDEYSRRASALVDALGNDDSVKKVTDEVEKVLEFKPEIINGPKTSGGADNIYYDTEKRILYFVRDTVNHKTGDFTVDTIEEQKKSWEEEKEEDVAA